MEQKRPQAESEALPPEARILFWLSFARGKHHREMELLLHEAKLGKKPRKGWNNVIKHQAGEAAAIMVLGKELKLPPEQIERQETFAFVHDAEKHDQVRPADFTEVERGALYKKLNPIFEELDPDGGLRVATNEAFFYQLFRRTPGESIDEKIANTSQADLLQYYIDSIFLDGKIVPALQRIKDTEEGRGKHLNEDPKRTRRLGMKYWDAERIVAGKVQERIWQWLKEAGTELSSPDAIPGFINQKIEEEMMAHWLKIRGERVEIPAKK